MGPLRSQGPSPFTKTNTNPSRSSLGAGPVRERAADRKGHLGRTLTCALQVPRGGQIQQLLGLRLASFLGQPLVLLWLPFRLSKVADLHHRALPLSLHSERGAGWVAGQGIG